MAHAAKMQGADLVLFEPDGVDLQARQVRGLQFDEAGWKSVVTRFPDVIDNDDGLYMCGPEWSALTESAPFTTYPLGGKSEIMKRIAQAGFHPELAIPSAPVNAASDILDFLDLHGRIVVKPARGSGGDGVTFIAASSRGLVVNLGDGETELPRDDIAALHLARFSGRAHVMQKYIRSRTVSGAPFDLRLHVRRDRDAKWKTVRIYARVGSGAGIASNIGLGGAFAHSVTFLGHQFGDRSAAVIGRVRRLADTLPEGFQRLYPDRVIDALGFDLGLDEDGSPWLFEVNSFPGARMFALDDAIPRIGYALRLARKAQGYTASV